MNMEIIDNRKFYNGFGFIDAIIAIVIVGTVGIVLMQIASNAYVKMVKNERIDHMTQYAYEGGVAVQEIATRNRDLVVKEFPSGANDGVNNQKFYFIEKADDGNYYFVTASMGVSIFPNDSNETSQLLKYADMAMKHEINDD